MLKHNNLYEKIKTPIMLTSPETCSSDDYAFKHSPGSCSDYSSGSSDNIGFLSDEDFLQFPSELDIPSLLTIDDHDINDLNTILDQSTDEILSEISSPHSIQANNQKFKKIHKSSFPNNTGNNEIDTYLNIQVQYESDNKIPSRNNSSIKLGNKRKLDNDDAVKNIPLQIIPKKSTFVNNQVVVIRNAQNSGIKEQFSIFPENIVIKNENTGSSMQNIIPNTNQVISPPSMLLNEPSSMIFEQYRNYDPKTFKKLQRKIKNRESACLSRKKKKDYLNSLEITVNNLTAENEKLKIENSQLRIKLAQFENKCKLNLKPHFELKGKIAICMFILVLGLNLNIFKGGLNDDNSSQFNTIHTISRNGRSLLSVAGDDGIQYPNTSMKNTSFSMCPAAINQSESARLVLNLERWIGKPFNLSRNTLSDSSHSKVSRRKYWKRKKYILDDSVTSIYPIGRKVRRYPKKEQNELQLFSPFNDQIYSDFFEAINRQEDTFYVVSFSENNMLLPALHHNRTRRPKMSLIMPTVFNENLSRPSISMMKIDCEVQDTQMINVDHGAILQHFKKTGNITNTKRQQEQVNRPEKKNTSKNFKKPFKPFFIDNNSTLVSDNVKYTLN